MRVKLISYLAVQSVCFGCYQTNRRIIEAFLLIMNILFDFVFLHFFGHKTDLCLKGTIGICLILFLKQSFSEIPHQCAMYLPQKTSKPDHAQIYYWLG